MSPVLLLCHSLFGFDSAEVCVTLRTFVYIFNVSKSFIWQSRNDFRFGNVQPRSVSVIESVKACVKFNLLLFFKRFKSSRRQHYFHRQWGAHGIIALVSSGQLSLNI